MEHLVRAHDESDRLHQDLLDVSNAAWPDVPEAREVVRTMGRSMNVLRVRRINIRIETRPAR